MSYQTEETLQTASAEWPRFAAAVPLSAASQAGWPEFDAGLLEEDRPFLPAFPVDVLPPPWREWVNDAAAEAGAPADYVAQALLAAVAGLAGAGVRVCVNPGWSEPLVLWQALVGAASTGKTPALETIARPLVTVEKLLNRDGGGKSQALVVHDAALPTLASALSSRPSGVLLWRDEPGPWLRELAQRQHLDAWSSRGDLAVSVIGSLHPASLAESLAETPDGLSARCLFAWPGPPAHRSVCDERQPREDEAVTLLHRIAGAVGAPDQALRLTFDEEARKSFDSVLARLDAESSGAEGLEAAWLGKGRGTVARLAGILALLDWSRTVAAGVLPRAVRRPHLQAAERLWQGYFRPHARAVLDRAAPSDFERQVRRVALWLKVGAGVRPQVSATEVRVQALGKTVNAARANTVLGRLWAAGLVRPASHAPLPQGGRPPQRWDVNPALAT